MRTWDGNAFNKSRFISFLCSNYETWKTARGNHTCNRHCTILIGRYHAQDDGARILAGHCPKFRRLLCAVFRRNPKYDGALEFNSKGSKESLLAYYRSSLQILQCTTCPCFQRYVCKYISFRGPRKKGAQVQKNMHPSFIVEIHTSPTCEDIPWTLCP